MAGIALIAVTILLNGRAGGVRLYLRLQRLPTRLNTVTAYVGLGALAAFVALGIDPAGRQSIRITLGDRLCRSFNARLRDELLNGDIFHSLREAQVIMESWRRHYNAVRPHVSLGFRPPAPAVVVPTHAA